MAERISADQLIDDLTAIIRDAENLLRRAVELAPEDRDLQLELANGLVASKRFGDARNVLQRMIDGYRALIAAARARKVRVIGWESAVRVRSGTTSGTASCTAGPNRCQSPRRSWRARPRSTSRGWRTRPSVSCGAGDRRRDPLRLGGLRAYRVVQGQWPVEDTAGNLAAVGHLAQRGGVQRGRHLGVDRFRGREFNGKPT